MDATIRPVGGHFTQLDALRGIAALTVVLNHFTIIDPLRWMWRTPLRFLLTGHDAVILFFIISGFVLTLQLTSSRKPGYRDYILKRICRIYLPFVAVFSLAYTVMSLVYEGPVPWAGGWANRSWDGSFSESDVVSHLVFLGRYRADHVIPVIWTLIYEMRISLFFPVIVFFVVRLRASHSIAAAMIISAGAYLLLFLEGTDPDNADLKVEWALTAHFTGIFVVGAVLAVHRTRWQKWLGTPIRRAVVFLASLGFYFLSRVILNFAPGGLADFLFDWGVAVGASGIICTSLVSGRITSILAWRPIVFLGAISYSLYLTHTVLLLSLIHLMPYPDVAWIALALAALLVFPVATLVYFLVERPSMAIGRALILRRQASEVG
jgi:peptidoglycan/LPS O-acetylase OafA/YrhL